MILRVNKKPSLRDTVGTNFLVVMSFISESCFPRRRVAAYVAAPPRHLALGDRLKSRKTRRGIREQFRWKRDAKCDLETFWPRSTRCTQSR